MDSSRAASPGRVSVSSRAASPMGQRAASPGTTGVCVGTTFMVPRGSFGPAHAKFDGGAMFDIIQRNRNGFVSQRVLKEHMARNESPVVLATHLPTRELLPQSTFSEVTGASDLTGASVTHTQIEENNECLAAKQPPAGMSWLSHSCGTSTAASPPSSSSQNGGSPCGSWKKLSSKVDAPPPRVLENLELLKEMTAPRKPRHGAQIDFDGVRNPRRKNRQPARSLDQVLESPADALGEAAIATCCGSSSVSASSRQATDLHTWAMTQFPQQCMAQRVGQA